MKESESRTHYRTVVGVRSERMEKHIGCMSGFLQIFDRHQLLAGKRIYSTKRLPHPTDVGASSETESSGESPKHAAVVPASLDGSESSPAEKRNGRSKTPVLVPKSTSKSCKEIHRHSLDSKLTISNTTVADADDDQRRSPSVIARLMGLEPLSSSNQKPPQTATKPALRRSASESSVSRDLIHSKYIDNNNFQLKQPNKPQKQTVTNRDTANSREASRTPSWRSRTFFDSTDFFPELNQKTVTIQGEFDKRLKTRGTDEQSNNDISTLKQILEVLQLKGLLRSTNDLSSRNSDRNMHFNESNIVLVKPIRSSASKVDNQRYVTDSRGTRRFVSENSSAISPKRDGRSPVGVKTSSPNRIESNLKACNPKSNTKQLSNEIKRKDDKYLNSVKVSPNDSTKLTPERPKRNGSVNHSSINRSFRNKNLTESASGSSPKQKLIINVVTEDEWSSVSKSVFGTPSTTNSKISKLEGCIEGKSLLKRCDKLLHNIAETNCTTESPPSSAAVLPSPVSVLDSGFDTDELLATLPCIDLKAVDYKDENGSPKISPVNPTEREAFTSNDSDFIYISEIVQASQHLHGDPNAFHSIKKQLYSTKNTSNVSKHHLKLVFDVVLEIINKNKQLPPWRTLIEDPQALVRHVWSEFQKTREVSTSDGVLDVVSGVIKKDLAEISGWRDYPIETSEAILDIERMIFKDLVSEAIRDLVEFSGECMFLRARRRLVF